MFTGKPVRDTRYRLLDVWRGVACMMVVLHHAGFAVVMDRTPVPGAWGALRRAFSGALWSMNLGVPLFFVISGYCIGAGVSAAGRRGDGAWRFLGRRFRRIYPAYWAALLGLVVLTSGLDAAGLGRLHFGSGAHALQLDSPGLLDAVQWAGNLTLTEEWRPLAWRPPVKSVFTRVAWSLCYEEQFYFVCFLALMVARGRLHVALAVVTVANFLLRAALADVGDLGRIDGAFPLLWHEFAVGLAVFWRLNEAATVGEKAAVDLALTWLAAAGWLGYFGGTPVGGSTAAAAVFGLVLIGLRRWDDRATRLAWLAPMRACGRWSYSIYLTHLPVCTVGNLCLYEWGLTGYWARALVMIPLVTAASVVVGWLFFQRVERHFLNPPADRPVRVPDVAGNREIEARVKSVTGSNGSSGSSSGVSS